MLIRKFNYTHRIKIRRSDVLILINQSESPPTIDAEIRLEAYRDKLPPTARLYVEAYHRTKFNRFPFGTVCKPFAPDDCRLTAFSANDLPDVQFRVKVIDESAAHGRILALAEGVGSRDQKDLDAYRLSLLRVDCSDDMGNRLWALDLDRQDVPWLLINSRVPDPHRLLRSDEMFFCTVYPEIVRQILTNILFHCDEDYTSLGPDADEKDWRFLWLMFGFKLTGDQWPDRNQSEETRAEWIEDCVDRFCRSQRVMQRILGALEDRT